MKILSYLNLVRTQDIIFDAVEFQRRYYGNLFVLGDIYLTPFCPCVVRKSTAYVGKKTINMRHRAKKGFRDIFVGIPQHQKLCLVYVPSTRKIISSYDAVFDESFSSALEYTPQPYSEGLAMRPSVMYTPCATSPW